MRKTWKKVAALAFAAAMFVSVPHSLDVDAASKELRLGKGNSTTEQVLGNVTATSDSDIVTVTNTYKPDAVFDKGGTAENTSVTLDGSAFTFTKVEDAENTWTAVNGSNYLMPNGSNFCAADTTNNSIIVTKNTDDTFQIRHQTGDNAYRYLAYNYNADQFDLGSSADSNMYNLTLLEVAEEGDTEVLTGWKVATELQTGKTYVIAYPVNAGYAFFYAGGNNSKVNCTKIVKKAHTDVVITAGQTAGTATITAGTEEWNVTVKEKLETGITVENSKKSVVRGSSFDKSNITVTCNYDDNTSVELDESAYNVTVPGTSNIGASTGKVSYTVDGLTFEANFNVVVQKMDEVPVDQMSATSGTIYDAPISGEGNPNFTLDGNIGTWWHSDGGVDQEYIIFTLENPTTISGIRFLHRALVDSNNGILTKYDLYYSASETGDDWTQILDDAVLERNRNWQKELFAPVEVKRIKLVGAEGGNNFAAAAEIRFIKSVTYTAGEVYPQTGLDVVAGSEHGTVDDGVIEKAFDNDSTTQWHSNWGGGVTGTANSIDDCWVKMEFQAPTIVNAVTYQPKQDNGRITSYEIYGSKNGSEWFVISSGTWKNDNTVKKAEFPAMELSAVKLVAKASYGNSGTANNTWASAAEINVMTATTEANYFGGGTIRTDQEGHPEKASLKFLYTFPMEINGMKANVTEGNASWGWKCGKTAETMAAATKTTPTGWIVNEATNTISSNIVFTNITADNYAQDIYTQLEITYTSETTGESMTIYVPVATRSVKSVVTSYHSDPTGLTEADKKFVDELFAKLQ